MTQNLQQTVTPSGWTIEAPITMTRLGRIPFIIKKAGISSYIEKRKDGWCCYPRWQYSSYLNKYGILYSVRPMGKSYKFRSLDDALLQIGMSEAEKNEVMDYFFKVYLH